MFIYKFKQTNEPRKKEQAATNNGIKKDGNIFYKM